MSDEEFSEGYRDGRDTDVPEPNDNRSACYRHSFFIGRCERQGNPVPPAIARGLAAEAEKKDAGR